MKDAVMQLRWPKSLRAVIQEAARLNRRSMNAEILIRLEKTLVASEQGERAA